MRSPQALTCLVKTSAEPSDPHCPILASALISVLSFSELQSRDVPPLGRTRMQGSSSDYCEQSSFWNPGQSQELGSPLCQGDQMGPHLHSSPDWPAAPPPHPTSSGSALPESSLHTFHPHLPGHVTPFPTEVRSPADCPEDDLLLPPVPKTK